MLYLFENLKEGTIPSNIIFTNGHRLHAYGKRWITASLSESQITFTDNYDVLRSTRGLLVKLDGWRLKTLPGFAMAELKMLEGPSKSSKSSKSSEYSQFLTTVIHNGDPKHVSQYKIDVRYHEEQNTLQLRDEQKLMIILQRPISVETPSSNAILTSVH
jgi:hypothetical protein